MTKCACWRPPCLHIATACLLSLSIPVWSRPITARSARCDMRLSGGRSVSETRAQTEKSPLPGSSPWLVLASCNDAIRWSSSQNQYADTGWGSLRFPSFVRGGERVRQMILMTGMYLPLQFALIPNLSLPITGGISRQSLLIPGSQICRLPHLFGRVFVSDPAHTGNDSQWHGVTNI